MPQNTHNHFQVVTIILTICVSVFESTFLPSEMIITPDLLLRMRHILKACSTEMDCPENAYCSGETCFCREGFLAGSDKTELQCLEIAKNLGDPCHEDVQCRVTFTVQAECRDTVCVCSDGSHYDKDGRRCYESVGIGQRCQTTSNCYVKGSQSFCIEGYCTCPISHHVTADGKGCLKSLFLGQNCTNHHQCITTKHSRCDVTCQCGIDRVLSKDKKQCLKAANSIGDPCEEDSQCEVFLHNAKCGEEKKCTCIMDFKRRGSSSCLRKINPDMMGESCSRRSQCVKPIPETDLKEEEVVNVDCLGGKCSCASDYILTEDGTDCIRFSENNAEKKMPASWLLAIFFVSRLITII